MKRNNAARWKIVLLVGMLAYLAFVSLDVTSYEQGPNNRNVSVDTKVNITNSQPIILDIVIHEEGLAVLPNITLNAGTFARILCNVSVQDFNGGATVGSANATFYDNTSSSSSDVDDNNTHYTNTSCAITGTSGEFRNFSCSFGVLYYANVGFWTCNVTVQDDRPFNVSADNYTHIDQILALNVTPLIDYGNLAVLDTSAVQQANVTNIGNWNITIDVRGYGGFSNQTGFDGDGLSFVCEQGNISVEYEKYNTTDNGATLSQYTNLSATFTQIPDLTIPQQTLDNTTPLNTTYWVLFVPPNPFGQCNGTVVFQANAA